MFAWVCIGLATLLTVGLVITVVHHWMLETPYVRTPTHVARAMVNVVGLEPGHSVYDLGAGDGSILLEARRVQPKIRATGVEVVPLVWLFGWLRTRAKGIKFLLRDARNMNLNDADVLFLYMTPHMLKELTPVLGTLKKGAKVVSRAFHLPGRTPDAERTEHGAKMFLYRF